MTSGDVMRMVRFFIYLTVEPLDFSVGLKMRFKRKGGMAPSVLDRETRNRRLSLTETAANCWSSWLGEVDQGLSFRHVKF